MKVRYVFYILLFVICALIPFRQSSTEISIHSTTPCLRINSWSVGQSSGHHGKVIPKLNMGTFITNSEKTCCVHVSVGYCDDQPEQINIMYPITSFAFELSMSHEFTLEKKVYSMSGPAATLFDTDTQFSVSAKFKGSEDKEKPVVSCDGNNGRDNKPIWVKVKFIGYYGSDSNNQNTVTVSGRWMQDTKDRIRQEYVDMTPPVNEDKKKRAELPVPGRSSFVPTISTDNGKDEWNTGHYDYMIDDGLKGKKAAWLAALNRIYRIPNGLSAFTDSDLKVNSAYRNPYHHRFHIKRGGLASFHSRHPFGDALDIHTPDVDGNGTKEQGTDGTAMRRAAEVNSVGALWTASYSTHAHADWTLRRTDGGNWYPPDGTVYSPPCNIDGTAASGPCVTCATTTASNNTEEDDGEGDDDADTTPATPTPTSPESSTPTTVTYVCGVHSGASSNSSDHAAASCGTSGHYVCDGSNHSLQASCTLTNSNGHSCTVTSFYSCTSHSHVYPRTCWRSNCNEVVSDAADHKAFCGSGNHSYWPGCPDLSGMWWHTRSTHALRPCSRCGVQFRSCNNTNTCNNGWKHSK